MNIILWHPKNLIVGPLPKMRDYDPGNSIDIELIQGCPDKIQEEHKSINEKLLKLSQEKQLINNIY